MSGQLFWPPGSFCAFFCWTLHFWPLVDFRNWIYFKLPRLSLGERLSYSCNIIKSHPLFFVRSRLPKGTEAQPNISIIILGIAMHSFTRMFIYLHCWCLWTGSLPYFKINKAVLFVIWASLLGRNAWVSWWPIQHFSAEKLSAAWNCPDIHGFISAKFPEQMNALVELSLGRHERWKNQRELGILKQWKEKKNFFQILYFLKD